MGVLLGVVLACDEGDDSGPRFTGELPCGELTCDAETEYCYSVASEDCDGTGGSSVTRQCMAFSETCEDAPSCECFPNAQCEELDEGVQVSESLYCG